MTYPRKILSITDRIVHVNYSTQYQLTSSFLRFQEHYEGEFHRGKVFTLKEFKSWYIDRTGGWTYYKDWGGFNFPGYILKPFIMGEFDKLSAKEDILLNSLLRHNVTDKHYVIGTFGDKSQDTLKHEIAHGLYHTVPEYRVEVDAVLSNIPEYDFCSITDYLQKLGYHPSVWVDEVHAYLLCNLKHLLDNRINLNMYHYTTNEKLSKLFDKHFNKLRRIDLQY